MTAKKTTKKMVMADLPGFWARLSPEGIDSRRVDKNGKWDFFWSLFNRDLALILEFSGKMEEFHPLPKTKNLDIFYQSQDSKKFLVISLKDFSHAEVFEAFCSDIVEAGEEISDDRDLVQKVIFRTLRWHHLLMGGNSCELTENEQIGLSGELDFLKILIRVLGISPAVSSWKGPIGEPKDFYLPELCVEIKSKKVSSQSVLAISSGDQLDDVKDSDLILRVCSFEFSSNSKGFTLLDRVSEIDGLLQNDIKAFMAWEKLLALTGFDRRHDYSRIGWISKSIRNYRVKTGFPRIVPPFQDGISRVQYSIDMNFCRNFVVSEEDFMGFLEQVGNRYYKPA